MRAASAILPLRLLPKVTLGAAPYFFTAGYAMRGFLSPPVALNNFIHRSKKVRGSAAGFALHGSVQRAAEAGAAIYQSCFLSDWLFTSS